MNHKPRTSDVWVIWGMIGAVVLPALLALGTVVRPAQVTLPPDPTPLGYTWSLLLFIVPAGLLGWWFARNRGVRVEQKAFAMTILAFVCAGFLLDIVFGNTFFTFPNHQATLQIYLPGYDFQQGWRVDLPIEEFAFYIFGALFMLLLYVWGDLYWFGAYKVPIAPDDGGKLVRPHLASLLIGLGLIAGAIVFKKFGPHPYHAGFPGYFTLLVLAAVIPSALFFPTARPYVNWRSFSFTLFALLLISLVWEATLGVPYQWWGYNDDQMMGLLIDAWSYLPVEAVLLWFAAGWGTVILYATLRVHYHTAQTFGQSFLRGSGSGAAHD